MPNRRAPPEGRSRQRLDGDRLVAAAHRHETRPDEAMAAGIRDAGERLGGRDDHRFQLLVALLEALGDVDGVADDRVLAPRRRPDGPTRTVPAWRAMPIAIGWRS